MYSPRRSTNGLSPRVRGNPESPRLMVAAMRSIPACAGEPMTTYRQWADGSVYPRVCGGTCRSTDCSRAVVVYPRVGGGTSTTPGSTSSSRVYPRVCGGTDGRGPLDKYRYGLSPRVRGNPVCAVSRQRVFGSIPACAGGTPNAPIVVGSRYGLSPRVRGTRSAPSPGKAFSGLSPRVRGNRTLRNSAERHGGSIPRVRGNPECAHRRHRGRRSIPACAGEPSPHIRGW